MALAALAPSAAVAQSASEADGLARADDLYKRGVDAFAEKRLDEALALLTEAWALKKSVDIAANLGMVEAKLGKMRESAEHLSAALRAYPVDGSAEARERLEQRLVEAKRSVAALKVRCNVVGATLTAGGATLGKTPLNDEIFVNPGGLVLTATADGYRDFRVEVKANPGESLVVDIAMVKQEGAVPVTPTAEKPLWPTIVLAGGAAAGLGLGIGFLVTSESAKSTLEDSGCKNATCGQAFQDDVDAYNLGRTIAIPGFIVGGLALVGMVTYLAVPVPDAPVSSTALSFGGSLGPEGGGASVSIPF